MPSDALAAAAPGGERRLHPATLLFAGGKVARQLVFPALAGGFSLGQGDWERVLPWMIAALAVPALVTAAIKYLRFRWRLGPDELVLRSGALESKHRVIPLSRIQNVELRQGALQRLLKVAELRVETAGAGQEAEAVLDVLSLPDARALHAELLARRRAGAAHPEAEADAGAEAAPPLVRLGPGDLVVAGATANEIGVIAAGFFGVLQVVDDLDFPVFEWLTSLDLPGGRGSPAELAVGAAVLAVGIAALGWVVSIAGALVRYHGFTLRRAGGELRKRYGLLTVHEATVPLERVQAVRLEESLLRRPFGLATLKIETAGGAPGEEQRQGGAEAFVPITRREEAGRLVRGVFGDFALDAVALRRVHPRSWWRAALEGYLVVFCVLATPVTWAVVTGRLDLLPLGLLLLPLPPLLARWGWAHRGWAPGEGYVVARSGAFNRVTWIIPDHKLQTLHVTQSPFQRRWGLASLVADTAAGGRAAVIEDLEEAEARALADALVPRVRAAHRAEVARRRALRKLAAATG